MEYFKSQVPRGAKYEYYTSFEPKEIISGQLKKLFHQYGYRQIAVPTFEYFDLFKASKGPLEHSAMLKFIDPAGDVLVLRPDCTLPIAKMVANSKEDPKQLRLSYISNVFRGNDLNESSATEFTQGGIEYFGDGSPGGEAEVILIAIKALIQLGFQEFQLDLSNIHFFKNLLARADFSPEDQQQYKAFIREKNFTALDGFLKSTGESSIPENLRSLLRAMPNLYGKPDKVFAKVANYNLSQEDLKPLKHLRRVVEILQEYGYGKYIRLDLSLINHFDYYDGILFQGYLSGHGKVIVQGGRYDPLTESFGRKIPSLGFGINIDEVIQAMKKFNQSIESPYYTDYLVLYEDQERTEAFQIAETIRNKGFVVEMNAKADLKEQILGAQRKNIKEIIVYNRERLELIDLIGDDVSKVYQNTFIKSLDDKDRNFSMVPIH
ncbi:ATP phosphoribosyltransferase regulatory subunit [Isachenkonia alkalipeptolytica]|uniref:ATP phosphoribosyltransferase regulatory subunit n=1 Tax=Isachenkonia alkalipeptolytica TaxID=2565777 RepID=A0AA44BCM7_9CLOT|nr:ATP phosphoribosyltransferase regulatory subunit [Isachenkonia alkalipeptolytica]NBG87509.1 ATP phosphoribosyltransferase regulatory subunit [Isachenkonia alkalipeptolytica]